MAQLVQTLRYKPEGRGFDWDFPLASSFRPHNSPGIGSVSNKHEYLLYINYQLDALIIIYS